MPPDDNGKMIGVLLEIKGEVGETKGKVEGICEDMQHLKARLDKTVMRTDCTGKHKLLEDTLARELRDVRDDLKTCVAEIKKSGTSEHPAITPAMLAAASAAPAHEMTPDEMERALTARAEERTEKARRRLSWVVGTTLSLIALLGILGTATWKIVTVLQAVNSTLVNQPAVVREEIQRVGEQQRIVYVQIPPTNVVQPTPPTPDRDPRWPSPAPKRAPGKTIKAAPKK